MAATMAEQIHVIENVPVSFPFTPYPCQIEYMEKVIKALQNNTNAILESPTGTGKTLSLLCATLSWRQQLPAPVISEWDLQSDSKGPLGGRPKIIYASRTHSQLSQAIHELKSTSYRPKVSIIGSRDQLCINSEVMSKDSNAEKVHACHAKVAAKSCTYYNNVDLKRLSVPEGFIPDIEELVGMGTKNKMCPYYLAREMKTEADLIFMPYNYILDLRTRLVHGINITNTVVILDEAHNIERVCEDSSSFELTSTDIAHCIKDIDYLLKNKYEEAKEYLSELDTQTQNTLKDLANLKELFLCLEDSLDKIELKSENNECVKPGSYIFEFLGKAGITTETHVVLIDQCSQAIASLTSDQSLHRTSTNLQKFLEAIKIVFSGSCPAGMTRERMASLHYRVYIKSDNNKRKKKSDVWTTDNNTDDTCRRLCYWCFNPGYAMTELVRQGVRSVILTSGTLSPLESFTSELQLEFPVSLQGSHVIGKDQVWVGVVSKGPDNVHLNSSYQTRFTPAYMDSLGNTLVNFFRIIPDGVLVFFPSYVVMETLVTHWKEHSNIFMRMEQHKQIFKEPKFKNEFNSVMSAYYEKIGSADKVGGAFFGVCRGKVSEGLDFADNNGRAVIITGLPYPPFAEPKVQLKMEYLKDARSNFNRTELITDKQWYNQQATRAVNQAIGRVIRHKNDYGAIILCDERQEREGGEGERDE
uniref:Regulator of telomere elongation helicase 1 homolog n=1 Tax=Amphimedon queenslandica TaxID=400682 RepID=A0A1X7V2E7_AMPQE